MSKPLRAPAEHDVADIIRLMSEHWPEPANEDVVRRTWSSPDFELEHDARLDGASYVDVAALGEGRVWIDARGRPSAGILDWAEARAGEKGQRFFAGSWSSNEPLLSALERRGFRLIRHSHRMRIDLDDPTPEPVWPEGLEVRSFQPGDERAFYEAHQETFEDSWEPIEESYDEWAHWHLESHAFVPELWFLAAEDGEPAGFAICHPHSGDPECGGCGSSGSVAPGGSAVWDVHSCCTRSASSGSAAFFARDSGSTPRVSRAPTGCTSRPACTSPPASTSTRRWSNELPTGTVS